MPNSRCPQACGRIKYAEARRLQWPELLLFMWDEEVIAFMVLAAVPGFIILVAGIILPESPSSLAEHGHIEKARKVGCMPLSSK